MASRRSRPIRSRAHARCLTSSSVTSGYNAQMAAPVHFGLRSMAPVRVEVTFMSRDGRKTQTVDGVDPADYAGRPS